MQRKFLRRIPREKESSLAMASRAILFLFFLTVGVLQSEALNTQLSHHFRPSIPSTITSQRAFTKRGYVQYGKHSLLKTKASGNLEEVSAKDSHLPRYFNCREIASNFNALSLFLPLNRTMQSPTGIG